MKLLAAWNDFRTICGIVSCDVNRGCSLACQQGLLPFTLAFPQLSLSVFHWLFWVWM